MTAMWQEGDLSLITMQRVAYDDMLHTARRIQAERDELRAEVEGLTSEIDEERVARENAEVMWEEHAKSHREFRAEVERLRAALEQIRDVAYRGTDDDVALLRIQAIASNALKV